jgi:hypothetical protein
MTTPIYYQLINELTGGAYKKTSVSKVRVPADADVADFRKEVKKDNPNTLSSVDASQLTVYKNITSQEALEEDSPMSGLGYSKKEAILIKVPIMHTPGGLQFS